MAKEKNLKTDRRRIRQKLERWGMDPKEIELCLKQIKQRQYEKMLGNIPIDAPLCTRAEYVRLLKKQSSSNDAAHFKMGDDYVSLDDSKYKPKKVDSLLNGVGRATGETAKVVKRGKTITKAEYYGDQ